MTSARVDETGAISVEAASYRLEVAASGLVAKLSSPAGEEWAALRPLAALDAAEGADETTAVSPPRVVAGGETTIEIERRSTLWDRAGVTVTCADAALDLRAWVEGRGTLTDVHLLGCRSVIAGRPTGFLPSGSTFRTLFSPNPERG